MRASWHDQTASSLTLCPANPKDVRSTAPLWVLIINNQTHETTQNKTGILKDILVGVEKVITFIRTTLQVERYRMIGLGDISGHKSSNSHQPSTSLQPRSCLTVTDRLGFFMISLGTCGYDQSGFSARLSIQSRYPRKLLTSRPTLPICLIFKMEPPKFLEEGLGPDG